MPTSYLIGVQEKKVLKSQEMNGIFLFHIMMINLTHPTATDVRISGGKGASLATLSQAGLPVPPALIVPTSAFEQFLKSTHLDQKISSIRDHIHFTDMRDVEQSSRAIVSLITDTPLPTDMQEEIRGALKILHADTVAVRSSATAEDSAKTSWAGELETFLNINETTIVDSVLRCWASLYSPRALSYRHTNHLDTTNILVAVVIQTMVESEVSGVCFTVHPVTNDRNQMIIEAGFGLGEAIVGGLITPDLYIVEKSSRRIVEKTINPQAIMITRSSEGTSEMPVTEDQQERQKLSDEQIVALARLCGNIEHLYQTPQDIEWTLARDQWYILQSRPITTL